MNRTELPPVTENSDYTDHNNGNTFPLAFSSHCEDVLKLILKAHNNTQEYQKKIVAKQHYSNA